ncbi:MAG: 50S ribosomal protein L25 [bacterium]|jgi:large subunit ribosomal protein L25|nr:50S ribosomal protein L25 [Verrucomicrobiota bacterium]MCX6960309.1 50S ribosomal protein L25 [Verrucomicrobiota bacterium]
MAKQVKLSARPRADVGRNSVKHLRSRGVIPAVIYGHKDQPANLEINNREIVAILKHAIGENILVELDIDGTTKLSLIQEVQHHPVRGDILHVDFLEVAMDELLHTEVPVEPFGEADGVKNYGGLLEHSLRSLAIECLPKDLPEIIRVDVSALGLNQSLHVRDLVLPAGVKATTDADLTVFIVAEPKVEVEPVAGAEPSKGPEVIKEKKPVEGAEAAKK